jgi:hypothetical protein
MWFLENNYYDDEDFFEIIPVSKKYYDIDDEMLINAIKNLRKKPIPERNTDFSPKHGVLGELLRTVNRI